MTKIGAEFVLSHRRASVEAALPQIFHDLNWRLLSTEDHVVATRASANGTIDDIHIEVNSFGPRTILKFHSSCRSGKYDWAQFHRNATEFFTHAKNEFEILDYSLPLDEPPVKFMREIGVALSDTEYGVTLHSKKFFGVKFNKVFKGTDLVQWIIEQLDVPRDRAIVWCQHILKHKYITHLSCDWIPFTEVCYYRLRSFDPLGRDAQ